MYGARVIVAVVALLAAVAAYGWSGLRLAAGSREAGSPLVSASWWAGTALQGAGFVLSLLARTVLPLLLVQCAIAGALAITAVLEHVTHVRRLDRRAVVAVGAVTLGIAAVAVGVMPGQAHAVPAEWLAGLWGILAGCAVATMTVRRVWAYGVLSGSAFGVGAVAGRLLVGTGVDLAQIVRFWGWTPTQWAIALLMPAGIVVGQTALTRGLARTHSVLVLGGDYVMATVLPSAVGLAALGERLRPGAWPLVVLGLLAAGAGIGRLLDA